MSNKECTNQNCKDYPYFGPAPHICFYKKGPNFKMGQSDVLPPSKWGENFVPELEEGERAEDVINPCGVYYCPTCLRLKPVKP